jgi:hypothetical protein
VPSEELSVVDAIVLAADNFTRLEWDISPGVGSPPRPVAIDKTSRSNDTKRQDIGPRRFLGLSCPGCSDPRVETSSSSK